MAQYSKNRGRYYPQDTNNDVHEVIMLTTRDGIIVDSDNPLPVSIGGESITITGPVTIPGEVEVSNDEGDPLHVDIVGQTFSLLLDSASDIIVRVDNEIEVKNDVGNPLNINILEGGVAVDGNNALPTRQLNDDGLIAYARGGAVTETDVLNSYLIDKSGAVDSLGTDPFTMTTVWDLGGLYPWNTFTGTGSHLFISSDSDDVRMRGIAVTLEGLDYNYNLINEVIIMDSSDTTTVKETSSDFYRVVKAFVSGNNTNSLPNTKQINVNYDSSGGTAVAAILPSYGSTQSCTFTVPEGYQGFILGVNGSSGKDDEITTMIWSRPFNGAWTQEKTFKFVSGTFEHNMRTPLIFDEKTDIEIRAYALVESSRIGTEFQLLLVPKVS